MMKIGIIGTASAGKTTLCYELLYKLKMAKVKADGVLQSDCRIPFERSLLDTEPLAQWWIIANQIQLEAEMQLRKGIDILICDRTPFDLNMYFVHLLKGREALSKCVEQWMCETFDIVILLRPLTYEQSPVRCTEKLRDEMDTIIRRRTLSNLEVGWIMSEPDVEYSERMVWRTELFKRIMARYKGRIGHGI